MPDAESVKKQLRYLSEKVEEYQQKIEFLRRSKKMQTGDLTIDVADSVLTERRCLENEMYTKFKAERDEEELKSLPKLKATKTQTRMRDVIGNEDGEFSEQESEDVVHPKEMIRIKKERMRRKQQRRRARLKMKRENEAKEQEQKDKEIDAYKLEGISDMDSEMERDARLESDMEQLLTSGADLPSTVDLFASLD